MQNRGTVKLIGFVYFLYFLIYNISLNRTGKLATTTNVHVYKTNYMQELHVLDPHAIHTQLKTENISAKPKHNSESFFLVTNTTPATSFHK